MAETRRWLVALFAALAAVGLVAFARGREHHRGDDVGALNVAGRSRVAADAADDTSDVGDTEVSAAASGPGTALG